MTDFEKWLRSDLSRSGLTDAEVKLMQVRPMSAESASKFIGVKDARPGILFPTVDIDGKPVPSHGAVRYFDTAKPGKFLGAALDADRAKYRLPKDSAARVSFTPSAEKPWREIIGDPDRMIVIVEGQKKAMRLSREGYNVIALHGVTMFSAAKNGRKLIDDLAQIKWNGREVLIIFDSDADGNPDVVAAERRLAGILRAFGARCRIVRLTPAKNGSKRGVDDFLQQEGVNALKKLIADASSGKYNDLLQKHALMLQPHTIVEIAADQIHPFHVFKQSLAPQFNERVPGSKGTAVVIKNFDLWLEDPRRKRYERLVFDPGGEYPETQVPGVGLCRNTWRGFPVKPERGDWAPWLEVHNRIYVGKPAWQREYSLDWYSHLVQRPGEKCNVVQVITGKSGVGKDMCPEFFGVALGRHFKQIDASDLKSQFTEFLEDTLLLNAMEVSSPDRRADADLYKSLVTRQTNAVNLKYGVKYKQTNHVRQVLTSNHCDPVFATDDERRFFVINSEAEPLDKQAIARMQRWRDEQNGPAHLLYYFLNRKISDGFNAAAPAPKTDDFYNVVEANRSELEIFVEEVLADPYGRLVDSFGRLKGADPAAPKRDVYSLKELLSFLRQDSEHVHSPKTLGKALSDSRRVARPLKGQVRLSNGKMSPRLWAIANIDFWEKASNKEWAYEYERGENLRKSVEKLYPPPERPERKAA